MDLEDHKRAATFALAKYDWNNGLSANPEPGEHHRGEARAVVDALRAAGWRSPEEIKAEIAGAVTDVVKLAVEARDERSDAFYEWAGLISDVAAGKYQPPASQT